MATPAMTRLIEATEELLSVLAACDISEFNMFIRARQDCPLGKADALAREALRGMVRPRTPVKLTDEEFDASVRQEQ